MKREHEEISAEQEAVKEEVLSEHSNSPKPSTSSPMPGPSTSRSQTDNDDSSQDSFDVHDNEKMKIDLLEECFRLYDKGNYSPRYLKQSDFEPHIEILSEEQNQERIDNMRRKIVAQEATEQYSKEELVLRSEAKKGMNEDEAEFSVETKLDPQIYLWSDKYRPRKPRYFNRVHTGFEWNKYNQTHYGKIIFFNDLKQSYDS